MTNVFLKKSISEIHCGYREKTINPVDIAGVFINQIERLEREFRAWVRYDADILLSQARESRDRILSGAVLRPLEGVPVGIKDIMNTREFPTEMGSPLWQGFTPGNDARVVHYVKEAGGMIPGKTVTAEFAVHTLDDTLNPHDKMHTPGTSSSGSAVAVALGMVPVALGTQTAGSIVRPASFCGVYGCKPSFGLIPRTGMLKTTDSLDTIGFFASRFEDLSRVFDVIRVHGPDYPISYAALNDRARQSRPSGRPWNVALVKTHTWQHAHDYAKKALVGWADKIAQEKDIRVTEVELPQAMERSHEIHATIYNKTLSYYFKDEFKKSELVSPIMNELISLGNQIAISRYHQALHDQESLAHIMEDFFHTYDVLISLSTAGEAPLRTEVEKTDPALMWTLTHLPVISVPLFTSPAGMPFGIQIAARRYNDILLFNLASYLRQIGLIPEGVNPLSPAVKGQ